MMEESAEDIENPPPIAASKTNPHNNTPSNDPNKKIKIALLSTFLLTAIVLAISLGVSFQGNPSNNVEEVGEGGELLTNSNVIDGGHIVMNFRLCSLLCPH